MNPAALKANLRDLPRGATIIVDSDEFTRRNLAKVGYAGNPLEDGTLDSYLVHALPLTSMTVKALEEFALTRKEAERAKNMFALGLLSWLYTRPTVRDRAVPHREVRCHARSCSPPTSRRSRPAGPSARRPRPSPSPTRSRPPPRRPGPTATSPATSRSRTGWSPRPTGPGCRSSSGRTRSPRPPTSCTRCRRLKRFDVTTIQAEDEIAGIGAALGAAYGGAIGVTTTSGPGLALKTETIGLAVSLELPLVVVDVQRGGPSTGLPTKTEQADLLQAMFGRNGEAPVPVVAPRSPADCFDAALEAVRIATTYRTPVILLSDGYLANGSEPWRIPDGRRAARPAGRVRDRAERDDGRRDAGLPAVRPRPGDPRPALGRARRRRPRAPDRRHREGRRHRRDLLRPGQPRPDGPAAPGEGRRGRRARRSRSTTRPRRGGELASVLVLGWGSTYGPIAAGARCRAAGGVTVATAHLRHLNPFPANPATSCAATPRCSSPR